MPVEVRLVETGMHGRVLVRRAPVPGAGVLLGFHGYMEDAEKQHDRMEGIPGAERWTLVSVQALHRFYRGRSEEVVASWMTRQDRETAIGDNVRYVDAVIASVAREVEIRRIVSLGFSQGGAMAFRAAVRCRAQSAGIVSVGADVPPELLADPSCRFPPALVIRGARDEWLTEATFTADVAALRQRGARVEAVVVDGTHEWTPEAAAAIGAFLETVE